MTHIVSPDGSGDFLTLQAAVDSGADQITVKPGTYRERVVVHRSGVRIHGLDGAALTFSNHATHRCGEWGATGARADLSARHPGQKLLTDEKAARVTRKVVMGGWKI